MIQAMENGAAGQCILILYVTIANLVPARAHSLKQNRVLEDWKWLYDDECNDDEYEEGEDGEHDEDDEKNLKWWSKEISFNMRIAIQPITSGPSEIAPGHVVGIHLMRFPPEIQKMIIECLGTSRAGMRAKWHLKRAS